VSNLSTGKETMSKATRTNKPLDQLTPEELDAAAARNERLVAMHDLLGLDDRYGEYRTMRLVAVGFRAMAGARRHNPDAEWSWIVDVTKRAVMDSPYLPVFPSRSTLTGEQ
jgi:hypothetical protein